MSRIRSRDTRPERALGRQIWRLGGRYRRYAATPVGRPDFVFRSARVAVFVDGCQWHGCPDHYVRPRTRDEFWGKKLSENVARDARQTEQLEARGWVVLRVWEHDVRRDALAAARRVVEAIKKERRGGGVEWRVYRVDVLDRAIDLEHRFEVDLRDVSRTRDVIRHRTTSKQ
jgi:DNA mismatch endonuclease (patch repair protein)